MIKLKELERPLPTSTGIPSVRPVSARFPKRPPAAIFSRPLKILALGLIGVSLGIICFLFIKLCSISPTSKNLTIFGQPTNYLDFSNKKQSAFTQSPALLNIPGVQFLPSLDHPLNVLVMGVDSNGKDTQRFMGTRSDTMMLVSLDPQQKKVGIVSIPRDSRVQIANRHITEKINSAHALGGPTLAVETVSQAFNVPIDRYLVIDEQGFKQLIEAFGPVDVLVEKRMSYVDHTAKLNVNLEPGLQKLDANQAEQYIRFRHDARGDIGRIERQQWFARQLMGKMTDPQILLKLPTMFKIASECVITDLNLDEMVRSFGFVSRLSTQQIKMATLPGEPATINGISYWVLQPVASGAVLNKLVNHDSRSQNTASTSYDSAMAFPSFSRRSSRTKAINEGSWSAIIRYPKGCEEGANALEQRLNKAGLNVKGKYLTDLADCQHEEIVQNTTHGLSFDLETEHAKLPFLNNCPEVINIDQTTGADLTFIVTPNSKF